MTDDIEFTTFYINYEDENGVREFEEWIGDAELQVRVYKNTDELNRVRGTHLTPADAYMNVLKGDLVMHFSEDLIALALIVHESIHAMFWNYDRKIWSRPKMKHRKKINIFDHPEEMVHFGGNLATIVYAQITSKFEVTM